MGFIRGFLLVIAAVLLFLSLISMTLFWTLSSSLDYESVQQKSIGIIRESLENGFNLSKEMDEVSLMMQLYCRNNSASDYVFSADGHTFDIPCETAMKGKDAIIDEGIRDLVYKSYYTKYECNFFDCFKKTSVSGFNPFFLVSEKTYNYVNGKFYFFLFISLVLTGALFFFIEKKTNLPILVGSLLIISSLPFIKLDYILSLFSDKTFFKFLGIFFSESYFISLKILIVGIILVIIGFILKIFKIGFFISNLISKIKKQPKIVKEKQKQQKIQPAKKGAKKTQKPKSK